MRHFMNEDRADAAAAAVLARALCQCPLLEELKLWNLYLRCTLLLVHTIFHCWWQLSLSELPAA